MYEENKKILLATDMSEDCRNAYNYAVNLATRCKGQITLLHVIDPKPISTLLEMRINSLLGEGSYQEIMQSYENDARSVLISKRKEIDIIRDALSKFRSALSRFSDDVVPAPTDDYFLPEDLILVKKGDVVDEIIATVEENQNDLIILSSHSGSQNETSISKTVQAVLQRSPIPVTVVPPIRI